MLPELLNTTWIHVFEEDTPRGAMYWPDSADIPLSRRPRRQLELLPDGTARVFEPDAGDRSRARAATWQESGGELVIRVAANPPRPAYELRVIEQASDHIVVSQ